METAENNGMTGVSWKQQKTKAEDSMAADIAKSHINDVTFERSLINDNSWPGVKDHWKSGLSYTGVAGCLRAHCCEETLSSSDFLQQYGLLVKRSQRNGNLLKYPKYAVVDCYVVK